MARKTVLPVSNLPIKDREKINSTLSRQKTKILHLSHTDIGEDNRILKELDAIKNLPGTEVFAIGLYRKKGKRKTIKNVKLLTIKNNRKKNNLPLCTLLRHFCIFFEFLKLSLFIKPQIVHCHDNYVLPIGWLLSLRQKSLLVYDAHELESQKNSQSAFESELTFWLEKVAWRKIKLFFSVSPAILMWYNLKFGKKNSALILNTPQVDSSKEKKRSFKTKEKKYFHNRFNIAKQRRIFVYLGHLFLGRGIEILIQVFKKQNIKSHLVFIGSNDTVGARKLAGVSEKIHFHPPVSHDKVVNICRHADYGFCLIQDVSLSDRLSLPNKLFEYAFSGIPVVASRLPEITRFVQKYRLGVCVNPCETQLTQAVLKLESQKQAYIINTQKLKEISWDRQKEKIRTKYKKLINSTKHGRGML